VKSRDAARERRAREGDCFQELEDLLPLPRNKESLGDEQKSTPPLDKTSLIRLTVAQLKCRDVIRNELEREPMAKYEEEEENQLLGSFNLLSCLDGFCLVVGSSGEVIFASNNIQNFVGLSSEEVLGQHLADFVHPCDQAGLRVLTPRDLLSGERRQVATTVRVKCTVTDRGRIINLKQANYKPLRLAGTARLIPPRDSTSFMGPVFIGTASVVGPDLGAPPQIGVFCTKHFADMRLAEANPWMSDVARYPAEDVLGLSFYDLIHSIDLPQVEAAFRNLREQGQCWTPPYRLLVRGGGFCWLQTRALCKPARRGSGRGTYIQCQHSQLTGVEEKGQVLAMIQGAADPPLPLPTENMCSDAAIAVGRRNETRTRLDPINKRQEARLKRKSFRGEAAYQMDQPALDTTIRMKPEQTKLALSPIKTEPAYLQNSPKAATTQIFLAPPLARNASSQTDKLTRRDKPSAGPKVSLQPPRPTTSVIWSTKSPFEVSRPVTLEATASSWKDAEHVSTVPLPRCSTPKLFAPRSSPAITTTSSKYAQLESPYYGPSATEVESMPKTFLRADIKSSESQNWQDSPRLDQRVILPSWLDVAEQRVDEESRKADAIGETDRLTDEKSGESDFFNSLFEYSGDELERLSPHSGDECISLTIPQAPTNKMSSPLDISISNGGPLQPQATLPSDLCEDFSQFFDSQATQLPGDCTSYFEAPGPTELEPQDIAMLCWSSDQRPTSRTSPPRAETEPHPWPSASSTSMSSHDGSLLDSRPIMLHSREYGKEEASASVERDADAGASHDRGTKRTKKKSPVGVEIKRIKSEVKVLQRR